MLVLTRKCNENLIIGEDGPDQVVVRVLRIKGKQVSLGIKARKGITIHREEVYLKIQEGEKSNDKVCDDDENNIDQSAG